MAGCRFTRSSTSPSGPGHYVIAAALVEPAHLSRLHRAMHELRLPGRHALSFRKEKPARRALLADAVARLPVEPRIYSHACDRYDEPSRRWCMGPMVKDLLDRQTLRLAINTANLD